MKKSIIISVIAFLLILIGCVKFSGRFAYAVGEDADESTEELESELENTVNDTINNLDLSAYDEFLAMLGEYNDVTLAGTVRNILTDILHGNNDMDFTYFIKLIGKSALGEIGNVVPQMLIIIVIALLYGVMKSLTSDFAKPDTQKIVYLACYGLMLTVMGYVAAKSINNAVRSFELIGKFTDGCFPVLITLITALGGSASAAVYQPLVMVYGTVMMKLITFVIMPFFYITFVFGLIGNLSDNLKLDKFSQTAKSAAQWILGIAFGLFITILTSQGITGASFDSLAAKGAKYMLSGYVPIIGNYLKDGFDIVVAGCIVVKNALGLCSVFIILAATLIPLIKIIIISLSFKLTAAVLEPIGESKFASSLYAVGESFKILIMAVLCASVSVLIMIMMLIYTCNFGVL